MQEGQSDKVIFIAGPTFAGKTHLISKLIADLPELVVVNYELVYRRNAIAFENLENFTKMISSKLKDGRPVIAESVKYHSDSILIRNKFPGGLNILVYPTLEQHLMNRDAFLERFGLSATSARTGGFSIEQLREKFIGGDYQPSSYTLFNGENYETVLERVKEHVLDD